MLNNDVQTLDRKIHIDPAVPSKQTFMEANSNAFLRWVPGHHMVAAADGTTKWYDNGALCKAPAQGLWSLRDIGGQ